MGREAGKEAVQGKKRTEVGEEEYEVGEWREEEREELGGRREDSKEKKGHG